MSNLIVLGVAFVIGAYNSWSFFASFAQTAAEQLAWGLGGFAFEVFKASVWRKAGRSAGKIFAAGLLSCITLGASVGQVFLSLERTRMESDRTALVASSIREGQIVLTESGQSLAAKIRSDTGPRTSIDVAARVESIIRTAAEMQTASLANNRVPTGLEVISRASSLLGWDGVASMVIVFAIVFLTFEITTVAYIRAEDVFAPLRWKWRRTRTQKAFLHAAVLENGELRGRRELVERGWAEGEVRRHLRLLGKQGRLVSLGRGRRLRYRGTDDGENQDPGKKN